MIEVVRYKPEFHEVLMEQEATKYFKPYFTREHMETITKHNYAFSVLTPEGKPLLCAGLIDCWDGRAQAWAVLDQKCKEYFLPMHNAVKRFLEVCPVKRIEATVRKDFKAGHRWARLLGFELETETMKHFTPEGDTASMYVRFN